jgi:hypothetical protein
MGSDVVVWDCVSTVVMALGLDENLDAQRLLVAFDELLKAAGESDYPKHLAAVVEKRS